MVKGALAMSSLPGYTLEEAIEDNFEMSSQAWADVLLEFYEPYREQIERFLENFEEETQSWRAQRATMWEFVPEYPPELYTQLHRLPEFKSIRDYIIRLIPHQNCKYISVDKKCTCWKAAYYEYLASKEN